MNGEPIGFCEAGICFPSRWEFEPGTTLALTLEICCTGERARAEGVVASCDQVGKRLWSVTVLFLDTSADMSKIRNSKLTLRNESLQTLLQ